MLRYRYKFIVLLAILLLNIFGVLLISTPSFATAQCNDKADTGYCTGKDIQLQIGIPGLSKMGLGSHCSYSVKVSKDKEETRDVYCIKGFPQYIKAIYNIFIGVVGILAVIMIMVGGFQWLLAAGNDQKISGAKTTIVSAVMGLILALTSYTILSIVNPKVLNLSLSVPDVSLSDRKTTGLCKAGKDGDQPILRKDDAPMCGKTYIKLKKNKNGQDEYCAGYKYLETADICYFDGNSTQVTGALSIEDNRKDGFGAQVWDVADSSDSTFQENALECGALFITCDESDKKNQLKWKYGVSNICTGSKPLGEEGIFCIVTGGDNNKANFNNVNKSNLPGTECQKHPFTQVGSVTAECKAIKDWYK